MKTRLKNVISSLYKPSSETMQVFALSRADAEQLPRLSSIAVISITAPGRPLAAVEGYEHLLRLSFEDVDFLNPKLSSRAKTKTSAEFTEAHAQLIRSFVEQLPSTIASVVVHCEGGFSRSCAVAFGLHKLYGHQVVLSNLEQANQSIVQVLMRNALNTQNRTVT